MRGCRGVLCGHQEGALGESEHSSFRNCPSHRIVSMLNETSRVLRSESGEEMMNGLPE